jgi:hypothetical protein
MRAAYIAAQQRTYAMGLNILGRAQQSVFELDSGSAWHNSRQQKKTCG